MKINEKFFFDKIFINTLISGTKVKRNQNCSILNIFKFLVNENYWKVFFAKNCINTLISGTKVKSSQNCSILNIFKFLVYEN